MGKRELRGRVEQRAEFQGKYDALLAVCDQSGTMVLQNREIIQDADAGKVFYKSGTREYIFPQHDVTEVLNTSRPLYLLKGSGGMGIWNERQVFQYSGAGVTGRLHVKYRDHDGKNSQEPHLQVFDDLKDPNPPPEKGPKPSKNSVFPDEVRRVLNEIFA